MVKYTSLGSYVGKRKRGIGKSFGKSRKRVRTTTIKTSVVPGFTRAAGFYGRYGGSDGETKFLDTNVNQATTNSMTEATGNGTIAVIAQGDGQSNREGRKCRITEVCFSGEIRAVPAAAGTGSCNVYVTWVLDTQANGAAAAGSDVWSQPVGAYQLMNLANEGRFKILSKQIYKLNSTAGVSGAYSTVIQPVNWRKRVSVPMEYDNTTFTTGIISTIRRNNILMFIADDINSLTPTTIQGYIRTRFVG